MEIKTIQDTCDYNFKYQVESLTNQGFKVSSTGCGVGFQREMDPNGQAHSEVMYPIYAYTAIMIKESE